MGGMAAGAWLASRLSPRLRDPLFAYAVIEALIGLMSLGFHDVFVATTAAALEHALPALGSPATVHAFKWLTAGLLIFPQSVLLGMTFPFMTGGVLRLRPERSGYAIAMLYFPTAWARSGVLASGFYPSPRSAARTLLAAASSTSRSPRRCCCCRARQRRRCAAAAPQAAGPCAAASRCLRSPR